MHIRTTGLKARDLDLELPKLVVLAGPNGSSKSTVTDGFRFAVLANVPALGKRLQDSAALMRGREMTVEIGLDDSRSDYKLMLVALCDGCAGKEDRKC